MQSCLICDDHALVREALGCAVGARWPGVTVHEAEDFAESWAKAREVSPDLCLVDLVMPGAEAMAGVAGLLEAMPGGKVIVVTGTQDDQLLLQLLDAGVHGFLQKTSTSAVILAAIELVLAGGRYLPPRVAEMVLEPRAAPGRAPTDRQRHVLELIAQGHSNKEIARELGVSPATVKTHVANAIASVGAANRTEAAIRAKTLGVI